MNVRCFSPALSPVEDRENMKNKVRLRRTASPGSKAEGKLLSKKHYVRAPAFRLPFGGLIAGAAVLPSKRYWCPAWTGNPYAIRSGTHEGTDNVSDNRKLSKLQRVIPYIPLIPPREYTRGKGEDYFFGAVFFGFRPLGIFIFYIT